MAKIFPDTNKVNVIFRSRAEEEFYRRCRKLSDLWCVYYSCNLAGIESEKGMLDNEMDFVLYHEKHGIIIVEVKGGRIKYQEGKFFSLNRFDELFAIKNPFQQTLVWKNRFLQQLRRRRMKVPVCHAVCFPSVEGNEFGDVASIETEIIIGRARFQHLERALIEISKKSTPARYAKFLDVRARLDKFIKGKDFVSHLYLRDYIDSHDLRLQDLDIIHETLVTPISSSKYLGIEGEAGTGKSMLAVYLARHFNNFGKKVLLLSSNPLQSMVLKTEVPETVEVTTFLELANTFGVNLLMPDEEFKNKHDDWLQFHAPERLEENIKAKGIAYDVLICDEAQDVQPFWWGAFKELLVKTDARFYLFFDRSQGIFGSGGRQEKFEPEDILPIPSPYFPLVHNYRTTREIATFSRSFRTGQAILKSHCGRLGYSPQLLTYQDNTEFLQQLQTLITQLVQVEKVKPEEITILSAREPNSADSMLKEVKVINNIPLHRFRLRQQKSGLRLAKQQADGILLSTVQSFKGLETKIAILVNFSEYQLPIKHPIMASLFYVACTRAKHMLYLLGRKGDAKVEAFAKAIDNSASAGSLLIDPNASLHDFVGTVIYYDAKRVGWLSVVGQNLHKSMIMFFPHDCRKAGIEVAVGKRIRFTPKNEGYVVVATDLRAIEKISSHVA